MANLYNASGNVISIDTGASKASDYYYLPDTQPDILGNDTSWGNINWTSDEVITNIYEVLRTKHPNYITRNNIGKDASGVYDMWCYIFAPDNYEYTVYLQGGVHGSNEQQGYWGLARLMYLVAEEYEADKYLNMLRHTVRFIVVPIVNPWNVTTKGNMCMNSNGINLNRNWLADNPEQEIRNIKTLLTTYAPEIDFGFDFHTDPEETPGWGGYLLVWANGIYEFFSNRLLRTNNYLYRKNLSNIKKAFMGDDLHYPQNSSYDVNTNPNYPTQDLSSSCSSGMWSEFGIPSATLEHGDRKFSSKNGTSAEMTAAIELYANHIIQQIINGLRFELAQYKKGAK